MARSSRQAALRGRRATQRAAFRRKQEPLENYVETLKGNVRSSPHRLMLLLFCLFCHAET